MRSLFLVAVTAFAASAAVAQQEPANSAAVAPVKEKKVCRHDVATGSIMPRRICHTVAEWQDIDAQVAFNTERSLNDHNRGTTGSLSSRRD